MATNPVPASLFDRYLETEPPKGSTLTSQPRALQPDHEPRKLADEFLGLSMGAKSEAEATGPLVDLHVPLPDNFLTSVNE